MISKSSVVIAILFLSFTSFANESYVCKGATNPKGFAVKLNTTKGLTIMTVADLDRGTEISGIPVVNKGFQVPALDNKNVPNFVGYTLTGAGSPAYLQKDPVFGRVTFGWPISENASPCTPQ